ncbi:MAG: lysophospholipid acyltransferase family protein [Myxococcota bacterium]
MWREVANGAFAVGWTVGWTSSAIAKSVITGDPGVVNAWTPKWAHGLARGWGMDVRAFGRENIDPSRTYVFMSNHQSHVDIVALFVALPMLPGFLAKKELRRVPFLGPAMEWGGHVFIDRNKRADAFQALADAADQVRKGKSIVIFPEGTRGDGQHVYRFKKGGFHLVKQAGVPLVPVGVRGTHEVLPKHSPRLRGGPVEVHIGRPVPSEAIADLPLEALIDRVRSAICDLSGLPPRDEAARDV